MTDPLDLPPAAPLSSAKPDVRPTLRLSVRRLRVDFSSGFDRLWNGGDAYRTQYMNALSMSFPVGEQFFIDSLKRGVKTLPPEQQAAWAEELRGFVGQEATHRFIHAQFNAELERQGLRNHWQNWAARRVEKTKNFQPINHVAITAALEHFTAVLALGVLTHPDWLAGASPEVALMWRWHAVEESEHKSVAVDVYRAMGGSERRRKFWFVFIALQFFAESSLQTFINLWHSGHWWRPRTWWNAARFLIGTGGLWWASAAPLAAYLRHGFHPTDFDDAAEISAWLDAQRQAYSIVA